MRKILTLSTFLLLFSLIPSGYAQGVVTGRVTDASGANVPNVRVELENVDTGQRITITTDTTGTYTFTGVPAGRYRVITSGSTTTAAPSQEITVDVSRTNTINLSLPSGPGTDAMTSTETVPTSDSTATISDVWNTRYTTYLPRANFVDRNGAAFGAYNLALLTSATASTVPGWNGGPGFAGQRPNTNMFHVDGVDNRNLLTGGPLTYLSNEATTEFSLFQNQATPLFGHSGGANFNSIMRSGTNQVHGSLYNYLQNRNLNAVDRPFRNFGYTSDDRPRYDQNRLGGSIGLPIVPSKVFFFGNFEYIPLGFEAPIGGQISAPTLAGFNTLATLRGVSPSNLGILRSAVGDNLPQTATGFTTVGGVNIPVGTVNNIQRHWQNQLIGSGAMDFNMSDKDQLRFRYVHNEVDGTFSGNALTPFQTSRWQRSLLANLSHYHTFGNSVTNELRLGYNRIGSEQYLGSLAGQPNIQVGGGFNLGLGPQQSPAGIVNTYHLADGVNVRLGSHQFKFGFDGRRYLGFRDNFSQFAGNYVYSGLNQFLLDLSPDVAAERSFGNTRLDLSQWNFFGYAHDTWRVTPGVSLDLGVRYQYSKLPNAFRNQGLNADASVPGVIEFADPQLQRWNFAPYVGIAVSPWQNRTVIRGSFGMWYDATYWQPFLMGFSPQFTRVATGSLTGNTSGFLAGGGLSDPARNSDAITVAEARRSVNSFIGGQEMPYSMQWNLAVQQALWRDTTIEFKYMGNRGVHQPVWSQLNYQGVTADRSLPVYNQAPAQAQLNALPLTLNTLMTPRASAFTAAGFANPINTINFGGNTWYNGATVALNHRFSGGFQMNANYTWSRWEDDATGTPLDIGMTSRMRSWSMFDRRHQANITGMFEVAPLFRDSWNWVRNVVADFNISGSYNYAIGSSLTPVAGTNAALANNAFGTSVFTNPDASGFGVSQMTPLRNAQGATVAYQVANPNARFIAPAPGVFTGFNRGGIRLSDIHNVNLAAVKRFNVAERASFEVRGEAFNLFNHPMVTGTSIQSIGSGMFAPMTMVPGTIDVNNLGSLDLLPTNARTLQLALRVSF